MNCTLILEPIKMFGFIFDCKELYSFLPHIAAALSLVIAWTSFVEYVLGFPLMRSLWYSNKAAMLLVMRGRIFGIYKIAISNIQLQSDNGDMVLRNLLVINKKRQELINESDVRMRALKIIIERELSQQTNVIEAFLCVPYVLILVAGTVWTSDTILNKVKPV